MTEKIIIAGAGGQGIMLLGKVLAEGAMRQNRFVTWFPSYGAEVRGGTAYCMVVISDKEIGSPYIGQADTLIIMNEPSYQRFYRRVKNKGLMIINSSLVSKNINLKSSFLKYPFTEIAVKLGNIKVANMVALGCYLGKKEIVDKNTVFRVIEDIAPKEKKDLIEINKRALIEGIKLLQYNSSITV